MRKPVDLLPQVREVVLRAGNRLRMRGTMPLEVTCKGDQPWDLLSSADLETQDDLMAGLSTLLPEACFVAEEAHSEIASQGLTWVIDPIDGTTNFVMDRRNYAISVALYEGNKPLFGLVYDVVGERLFEGVTDKGAWLNGDPLKKLCDIPLEKVVLEGSLSSFMTFLKEGCTALTDLPSCIRGHRCLGAASLSLCHIALGYRHAYVSDKVSSWDIAAAVIILQEVGGHCAGLMEPCRIDRKRRRVLAASSPALFETLRPFFTIDGHLNSQSSCS